MKIGVLTNLYRKQPLDEVLSLLDTLNVHTVEIGAGGYPGHDHCDPQRLISDPAELKKFKETLKNHGTTVAALSAHGNPLHPNKDIAMRYEKEFCDAVRVAELLEIDTIVGFSGCPGDSDTSQNPNWVTCAWPTDFANILKWQWEEKLIPYWSNMSEFARSHGIKKIAFEMHPGFCVYNPASLLRLRSAIGDIIGANFDPSHLIWQGIDPVAAIRALKGAIYHVHAKDTKVDKYNTSVNGVLDTRPYKNELERSWIFRTVGYGNDESYWKDMISNLRLCGYDGILSIEHEDSVMSTYEGLEKAVKFLEKVIICGEKPSNLAWV